VKDEGVTVHRLGQALAVCTDARSLPPRAQPSELSAFLAEVVGEPVPVLFPTQRHTAIVFTFSGRAPALGRAFGVGICDALITAESRVALGVQTADCLPVVLSGGGVVGVVHAGWRGLAQGILAKTVRLFSAQFAVKPAQLQVLLGVSIGPCHYPVGQEVLEALALALGRGDGFAEGNRLDLRAFALLSLQREGIPPSAIRLLPGCTACSPHYHSYRRDGERAGRQWTFALLTGS
jgi:YfiH family protein